MDPFLSQANPVQQDTFGQAVVPRICLDFCRHIPIASSEATPQDNENLKKWSSSPPQTRNQDKLTAGRKITSSWTHSYIFKRSGKSNQCYNLYRQNSFSCLSQARVSLIITEILGRKENTYSDKTYVLFSLSFLLGINVTLWHVRVNIVVMRSAEMSPVHCSATCVTVNNKKVFDIDALRT